MESVNTHVVEAFGCILEAIEESADYENDVYLDEIVGDHEFNAALSNFRTGTLRLLLREVYLDNLYTALLQENKFKELLECDSEYTTTLLAEEMTDVFDDISEAIEAVLTQFLDPVTNDVSELALALKNKLNISEIEQLVKLLNE